MASRVPRILVAEDDRNILNGLVDTLESEGYEVTPALDGKQALELISGGGFHLILLDIMMPEKSGYDVCAAVRANDRKIPIIMLTAKGEEIDKVVGLRMGADDYITKPFGVHELIARIEAALRRSELAEVDKSSNQKEPRIFKIAEAEVNTLEYKVKLGGKEHDLSGKELKLLRIFHDHPNEVLSREKLLDQVWGITYFGTTRTLDQHIAKLRKKIEPDPSNPVSILTVHGLGYKYSK